MEKKDPPPKYSWSEYELTTKKKVEKEKKNHTFGNTVKILQKAAEKFPKNAWFKQQLALCTYKNKDIFEMFFKSEN